MAPPVMAASPLDHIARRDFREWRGLPHDAGYAEFEARFPRLVDAEAVGLLGTAHVPARYRIHVAEGYPQHLKAWYVDAHLILVEATLPQLASTVADLLEALGEPAARLDSSWGVLTVPGGLRVHPDRGIAVFVGPESQVLRVSLFAPGTPDDFTQRLRVESQVVERPLRESDRW